MGGESVAYHDTDEENRGSVYRDTGVDINSQEDSPNVNLGWIRDGEWVEYTVDATGGTYDVQLRVATANPGNELTVLLGDETLGTVTVPDTGGWDSWQTVTIENVAIPDGEDRVLRLEFSGDDEFLYDLDWFEFTDATHGVETVSGNPTCSEVGDGIEEAVRLGDYSYGPGYRPVSGQNAAKTAIGQFQFEVGGTTHTLNISPTAWNLRVPTEMAFNSSLSMQAVIVGGEENSNIYRFTGTKSSGGLQAPRNDSGQPGGIWNLTFCSAAEDEPGEEPRKRIRIESLGGGIAVYNFTVEDALAKQPSAQEDTVSGTRANGHLGPDRGTDTFTFTGDITGLSISGPAAVYVDGERIDPQTYPRLPNAITASDFNPETGQTNTLRIESDGTGLAAYEFNVTGTLEAAPSAQEDTVSGTHAHGHLGPNSGTDTFTFTGDITDFSLTGPASVYLNGEAVTAAGNQTGERSFTRGIHEVTVSNRTDNDGDGYASAFELLIEANTSSIGEDVLRDPYFEILVEGKSVLNTSRVKRQNQQTVVVQLEADELNRFHQGQLDLTVELWDGNRVDSHSITVQHESTSHDRNNTGIGFPDQPEPYSNDLNLENSGSESRTITVIVLDDGTVVYNQTLTLAADSTVTLHDLAPYSVYTLEIRAENGAELTREWHATGCTGYSVIFNESGQPESEYFIC